MEFKKLCKRVIAGALVLGVLGNVTGNAGCFSASASPAAASGNHPNANSSLIPGKMKKNNGKKVNQGNAYGQSWNQKMIRAEHVVSEGKQVKVVLIDSGVNYSSDIFVKERMNFIEEDECSVLYEDFSGHGTAIAGIIAAADNEEGITGINPNVEIYSARVLDGKLEAPIERIVAAIDWAIEKDADIINMSFGIPVSTPELYAAVTRASQSGALLVASTGQNGEVVYPAAYPEVIAVGAVDALGNAQSTVADGYCELMAPGVNVLSSAIFDGVRGESGTSLSAAHVTGVASVLMEQNPDMPAEFIRALMDYSANLYGDAAVYGNGVVDLEYATAIAPSVKKNYDKYLRKINQNEVQKKKASEKFWGEILRTVPENEKDIETFEGLENVVGLWSGTVHGNITTDAADEATVTVTQAQLDILLAGSKYPDKDFTGMKGMSANPYHGLFRHGSYLSPQASNYLANYIYLTRIAMNGGTAAGITAVSGMSTTDKSIMDGHFSNGKVGDKTFAQAFSDEQLANYSASSVNNRKLFVYGIAMHLVGDVYAHSAIAYVPMGGVYDYRWLDHDNFNCDSTATFSKRYDAAVETMKHVISHAVGSSEGLLQDFGIATTFYGSSSSNRFYLNCLSSYAQAVNPTLYSEWARYNSYYYTSFNYGNINLGIDLHY